MKAELVFAHGHSRTVLGDPNATHDDVAGADDWVTAVRPAAERAAGELAEAETAHQAHQEWSSATARIRAAADAARKELAVRAGPHEAPSQDLAGLPTSWVAYQAVQAERALAAKERPYGETAKTTARSTPVGRVPARTAAPTPPGPACSDTPGRGELQTRDGAPPVLALGEVAET